MSLSNEYMASCFDRIKAANLEEAQMLLKSYEDSVNDPFNDGTDMAGDIFISNAIATCLNRIKELTVPA